MPVPSPTVLSGWGCLKGVAYCMNITLFVSILISEDHEPGICPTQEEEIAKVLLNKAEKQVLYVTPVCCQDEMLRESYAH